MKVSVVVPTYERPQFLDRLLQSIQQQTYREFEVIVVDDCSDQKKTYRNLIEQYQTVFPSLTYLRNEKNSGAPYTRNRGISIAKGDLIALVDDDDEWLPEKLRKQVEVFEKSPDTLGLVYTWAKAMDNDKVFLEYTSEYAGCPLSELLLDCFIPSPSVMVSKKAIFDAALFDTTMPSCQDWDMWTRILAKGYTCDVVKSFETIYHKHQEETIGTSSLAAKGYELYYKKHLPLYKKYHKKMYLKMKARQLLKPLTRTVKRVIGAGN